MSAAPPPWTTRMRINQGMFWAAPASAVEITKTAAPIKKTRRRPNRSPSLPPSTMNAARGNRFAVRTHGAIVRFPPSPSTISGVASGTAVWSTRIMLFANVIATSVSHIDLVLTGLVSVIARSSSPRVAAARGRDLAGRARW